MFSLSKILFNRYTLCISILSLCYILTNLIDGALNYIDYPLIMFVIYLELYDDESLIAISCILGVLYDLASSNIVGVTTFLFLMFAIIRPFYLRHLYYNKIVIKIFYYISIPFVYIFLKLLLHGYSELAFKYILIKHFIPDIMIILVILSVMRLKRVF